MDDRIDFLWKQLEAALEYVPRADDGTMSPLEKHFGGVNALISTGIAILKLQLEWTTERWSFNSSTRADVIRELGVRPDAEGTRLPASAA